MKWNCAKPRAREGERIELVRCSDPYTRLRSGARGTVQFIDSLGTVHVKWDDGHYLGLIPGEDEWKPAHAWGE